MRIAENPAVQKTPPLPGTLPKQVRPPAVASCRPARAYALPMSMPATKTSAPPRITCIADIRKLIRKYR